MGTPDQEPTQGSLLVVDDDELNRDMLSRRLQRRGFDVETAEDGHQALECIERRSYDVILLDVMMPGIDGLEVLRRIRDRHAMNELPIIMATAKDTSEEVVQALELGANDYVTKPLDFPVVLARVRTQLELKRARDQLVAAHARMKKDLDAAARLQRALIPKTAPEVPGLSFAWHYRPCDELAGDTIDLYTVDDNQAGLYLLDVSGHGVPAALLSFTVHRLLSRLAEGCFLMEAGHPPEDGPLPPAEVARRLNKQFPMELETMQYFTFLHGLIDAGTFRFVSAAHPGPILVPAEGEATVHGPTGSAIGWFPDTEYGEATITLQAGDRLFLCSDGVFEAESPEGESYGFERLLPALEELRAERLDDAVKAVVRNIEDWCGPSGPGDDISIVAAERLPDC